MEILPVILIIISVILVGYLVMIYVIYFLAPTKIWNTFPEKCHIKTKCTRIANNNNRGHGLKPPVFDKNIKYIESEITKIIESKPRMKIVNQEDGFIHAVDITPFFRFYDDIAIKIFQDSGKTTIWIQSQSRLGYYDFQVNEKRVQMLHKEISSIN
ncbi:MAG: DUF1499 domain-containing protein [Candidatus Poseidoniales archaeon]